MQALFCHPIAVDGVSHVLRRVHADPDRVDFLDLVVVVAIEVAATLRGHHAACVVCRPLQDGIAGICPVLCLDVDDEHDGLFRLRNKCLEQDVVPYHPLRDAAIFGIIALDALIFLIRLIWMHRHLTDERRPLDVLRHDVLY